MSFAELGLTPGLLQSVQQQGYTTATPIQAQAIPEILAGKDVMAAAQTGTGKTAGFVLPILQRLGTARPDNRSRAVRALVLTPTRELAAQVQASVKAYGAGLPLRSASIFGGVGMQPQVQSLRRGVDIVVATPGRLLDHLRRNTVDLSQVETLVLDEADRMLDMGFIHDIRQIIAACPKQRQTLMFSATFSDAITRLAAGMLDRPVRIEVAARYATAETVVQKIHPVNRDGKRHLLTTLIRRGDWQQVLVFTETKRGADRLASQLDREGLGADAIHGNKSQGARTRTLDRFRKGGVRILVATDIAARGLDIDHLPHVVNYELPNVPEDYLHRIGRTGRAGRAGAAVSLVSGDEHPRLREIERLLKRSIEREVISGCEPDSANELNAKTLRNPNPPRERQRAGTSRRHSRR